jgi:hypothetical protein
VNPCRTIISPKTTGGIAIARIWKSANLASVRCKWQAQQPKDLPDEVLANMIAKRIVAKKGAEKMTEKKQKKGQRSLAELAEELEWE